MTRMNQVLRDALNAFLVLFGLAIIAPVFAGNAVEFEQYRALREEARYYDDAANQGNENEVRVRAKNIKRLLKAYEFDSYYIKFAETVDIVIKQGDRGDVFEALLAEEVSSKSLIHFLSEGFRHYEDSMAQSDSDAKTYRQAQIIELLVSDKRLDVTAPAYIKLIKASFRDVPENIVTAVYQRGISGDMLDKKIEEHGSRLLDSNSKEAEKHRKRLALLLDNDFSRASAEVKHTLLSKLVNHRELDDLTVKLLRGMSDEELSVGGGMSGDVEEKLMPVMKANPDIRMEMVGRDVTFVFRGGMLGQQVATYLEQKDDVSKKRLVSLIRKFDRVTYKTEFEAAVTQLLDKGELEVLQTCFASGKLSDILNSVLADELDAVALAGKSPETVIEKTRLLLKETGLSIRPELFKKAFKSSNSGIRHWAVEAASAEQLQSQQQTLVSALDDAGIRKALDEKGFFFQKVDEQPSIVAEALEQYRSGRLSKEIAQFIIRHYRFSDSDEDVALLASVLADSGLTCELLAGEEVINPALLQAITERFLKALKAFDASSALSLMDDKGFVHLPEPEEGFTQLICELTQVKMYPEPPAHTYKMLRTWIDSTSYQPDWEGLSACHRRAIKRQCLGIAPLANLLQLLRHYDVAISPEAAEDMQAMVLNNAVSWLSVDALVEPSVRAVFEVVPWLVSKAEKRLKETDKRLYTIRIMSGASLAELNNAKLTGAFVKYVLGFYPSEIYDRLLSDIYDSGNTLLLAHTLADARHYQHIQAFKETLFSSLLMDLLDLDVKKTASLMLHACIIPAHEVNDEVTAISAQCDARKAGLLEGKPFTAKDGVCFADREDCVSFDRYPVDESLRTIISGH